MKNVLTESYDRFEENDLFLKFKYHRKLRYRSRIDIVVGGIHISAIIDYSAPVNIIDKHLWEYLKNRNSAVLYNCPKSNCVFLGVADH